MAAPPQGCSPLSSKVWMAQLEAGACGKGYDEGHEWEHGGEVADHGSGCPARGEREREGVGGCVGVKQGCGSGKGGLGPWSRSLVHHSGCGGRERAGTLQGGTTGDWEEAPRHRS